MDSKINPHKVYMTYTGDVLDEEFGTVKQHYRYAFKHNGIPYIGFVLGHNRAHCERQFSRWWPFNTTLTFVDRLKEAMR